MRRASEWGDINTAAGMYISDSRQYESLLKELETQLQLVNFIKQYLQDGSKVDELIPSNIGLTDLNIENQIALYNETLLKRNRLVNGSGSNHPVVQELNRSLQSMRQNIYRAVDNLSTSLSMKEKDFSRQETMARQKVQTVPRKQREMLSVERQQKVKESLYIFLLNKREENALNQAMVDNNARIIDPPYHRPGFGGRRAFVSQQIQEASYGGGLRPDCAYRCLIADSDSGYPCA